jgi:hypothetical protein
MLKNFKKKKEKEEVRKMESNHAKPHDLGAHIQEEENSTIANPPVVYKEGTPYGSLVTNTPPIQNYESEPD